MNHKRPALRALTLLIIGSGFGQPAFGQQRGTTDTIRVTGRGVTRWAARSDAIRQALQQRVGQLVIADRAVSGDNILKDETISTLNGFVQSFEVRAERKIDNDIEMDAAIVVGSSEFDRFIARRQQTTGARVDGDDMLAKLQGAQEAERSRAKFAARLFDGFPAFTTEFSIDDIQPHPRNRESVVVVGQLRTTDAFVRQLTEGFDALSRDACSGSRCEQTLTLITIDSMRRTVRKTIRNVDLPDFCDMEEHNVRQYHACTPAFLGKYAPTERLGQDDASQAKMLFFHGDVAVFGRPEFLSAYDSKDLGDVAAKRKVIDYEKDLCNGGTWYSIKPTGTPASSVSACVATGPRTYFTLLPIQFFEGAKAVSATLVSGDLLRSCRQTLDALGDRFASSSTKDEANKCLAQLTTLIQRRPRLIYDFSGRLMHERTP